MKIQKLHMKNQKILMKKMKKEKIQKKQKKNQIIQMKKIKMKKN